MFAPALPIIMRTVYDEDDYLFDSLKAGASGYLLKRALGDRLVEALQQAQAGGLPFARDMAAQVKQFLQKMGRQQSQVNHLSPREQEVLQLLADGFRYKEIAAQMGVCLVTDATRRRASNNRARRSGGLVRRRARRYQAQIPLSRLYAGSQRRSEVPRQQLRLRAPLRIFPPILLPIIQRWHGDFRVLRMGPMHGLGIMPQRLLRKPFRKTAFPRHLGPHIPV